MIACVLAAVATPALLSAQSAENVAVVINDKSADSRQIGEYYALVRGLPASNVLRIQTTSAETIDRDTYVRTVEQPLGQAILRAGLEDRLLCLVLTRGVPLVITGTPGLDGTRSSVDSELTLLYRRLTGRPAAPGGTIENPYYLGARGLAEARPFSHRDYDIYLVTRLDAYTLDQARALVDRAQAPVTEGRLVLDRRGASDTSGRWLASAADRLSGPDLPHGVTAQTTDERVEGGQPVLGYYSAGPSDPTGPARSLGMAFAAGALAANFASADARTFRAPPDVWRPTRSTDTSTWFAGSGDRLIGDLVRDGVTGVSGQVAEAYVLGAVHPDVLFPAYLAGFNLAEAFYLSIPVLSWQTVVVGDPLCAPFGRTPLTPGQLEDPIDASTGLPGLFSRRRVAALLLASPGLPEAAVRLIARSETLLARDDRAGAIRALEQALALAPRTVNLMVTLAQLEEEAGDDDAAFAHYRRALELQPTNVFALNNLAFGLAVRHDSAAEALTLARRAATLAPRAATVLDTLGWVDHLAGNDAEAANIFEQAVQLQPDHAGLRLHAAIVFAAIGNGPRAAGELDEALRIDPSLDGRDDVRQLRERLAALNQTTAR